MVLRKASMTVLSSFFAIVAAALAGLAASSDPARGTMMLQVSANGGVAFESAPAPAPHVQLAKISADSNTSKSLAYRKLIKDVLKEPFVDGWDHYVGCVEHCAEHGGGALECAHQCYNQLAPVYQDLPTPEEILGTPPPPTPSPESPESCNGNPDCLWLKCCHYYTATCLSCVVGVAPAELCQMNEYLSVPGCAAALLEALQEEKAKHKEDTAV